MAVPKCKKSKSKKQMRKRSHKGREIIATRPCPQCGAAGQSHRVCSACGYYAGRQVLTVEAAD
ncbi:MAG: 50S ribosomal protein L32 [Spartobacteria bacterium]|nr:50S ribosomal protein L32 [Spartobacteria bacterium]